MSSVEHWRMRKHRLCLEGETRTTPEGAVEYSINGVSWHERPNGHHKDENPLKGIIVYQAHMPLGENGHNGNGRKPINISGEIKIPASVS
ncbi:hypothetical protein KKE18_01960 [Patescibacteria group bacterium]|nr:hypothetical protein [Patescibacteria group bacterium]MBU0776923.1 hypothetical protein [Patescibacteria group bacterium]MBU0922502.1 hypothetical protein [Patescibacteria group bacterium]MBU1845142.1 hypothetical protein [Patescibacteria group bacterium]